MINTKQLHLIMHRTIGLLGKVKVKSTFLEHHNN